MTVNFHRCAKPLMLGSGAFILSALSLDALAASAAPASPVSFWSLLQVLLGLGVVLGAVVLAAWGMRRLQPAGWTGRGPLRVLAMLPLGTRERVVLVKVGEEQVLLGVTATQINSLLVLSKPLDESQFGAQETLPQFPDWLKKALQAREKKDV